jgi:hypothetical protein
VNTAPFDFDAPFVGVSVPELCCRGVDVPDFEVALGADAGASLAGAFHFGLRYGLFLRWRGRL